MHLRLIAVASLAALTSTQAQITTVRPNVPRLTAIVSPDVPLLIGLNSGTAIQIDDMTGAAAQTFSDGFWIGRTSAAPVLGRGINGQLIALVPGQIPQRQILLPSPGWQPLEKLPPLVNFTIDPSGSVLYGVSCDAGMVEKNVAQARYLESLVNAHPNLQLMAPVPLNVVCFRYVRNESSNDEDLDEVNARILVTLQEKGLAVPSGVVIAGKFALRVANVNHRSTKSDFDALVADVVRIGSELNR